MKTPTIRRLLILNLIFLSSLFLDDCKKEITPFENINDGSLSEKSFKVPIAFPDQGKIVSFNFNGDTVYFRKVDSLYIFQGDLIFTESQINLKLDTKGSGINIFDRYWPNGIIPFRISQTLSQQTKDLINVAITHFNEATNVKFIQRTNELSFCDFVKASRSSTGMNVMSVGMTELKKSKVISIRDEKNLKLWQIEHEICHALGMLHEQCRSDRNEYIIVNEANIKPLYKNDFRFFDNSIDPTDFDFGSIMMFPPMVEEMAIDKSKYLITDLDGNTNWTMEANGLSGKDIETINCLYPVNGKCTPVVLSPKSGDVLDNGCTDQYDLITWSFKWSRCAGAKSYNLYVQHKGSIYPIIDAEIKDPNYLISEIGYIEDQNRTDWSCKVRAKINGEWGEWSNETMFDVEPVNTDWTITPARGRDILFSIMKYWYYWFDMPEASNVTEANKNQYPDPYALLEAMRYQELDRFSFILSFSEYMGNVEGDFAGHGITLGLDQDGNTRIAAIYNHSNLYPEGVRRGWIVKKINNIDITPDLWENGGVYNILALLGPPTPGITNTFLFINPSGEEVTITSAKSAFTMNAVLLAEVLPLKSGPTGHLVLDTFWPFAYEEIEAAFTFFKANGVQDLILDLRYNSGGDLFLADILASYIVGNSKAGATFLTFKHNSLQQAWNYDFPFLEGASSLDLSRVAIITTSSTASASEAVINGLKPYLDVVTIGSTTNGKPVGMYDWDIYQTWVAMPIAFEVVNSLNQGGYYSGILPTKNMLDDITHDFSDKEELCLKEAINYLETGSVSTKGIQQFKSVPTYSEKPEWMNNSLMDINKNPNYNKIKQLIPNNLNQLEKKK